MLFRQHRRLVTRVSSNRVEVQAQVPATFQLLVMLFQVTRCNQASALVAGSRCGATGISLIMAKITTFLDYLIALMFVIPTASAQVSTLKTESAHIGDLELFQLAHQLGIAVTAKLEAPCWS